MTDPADRTPKRTRLRALAYRTLGVVCVGLATAGLFLPVMPTTVFLLVAVWAFARSSPELAARLYDDPRFGPLLRDWRDRGVIPRRAKALAVGMMAASLALLALVSHNPWVVGGVAVVLAAVAGYIVTRPST
ncbi:YbaN family protein [Phenylobacterium sp.]|uniref:YbaN family protein n=1 Tax=Phenylobacterium sp. TaxID=1871053 RepID=UPI003782D3A6